MTCWPTVCSSVSLNVGSIISLLIRLFTDTHVHLCVQQSALYVCQSAHPALCLSISKYICPPICLSVCLSGLEGIPFRQPMSPSVRLSLCLSVRLSVCLSLSLSHTHTHTQTHALYVCLRSVACVCVCVSNIETIVAPIFKRQT